MFFPEYKFSCFRIEILITRVCHIIGGFNPDGFYLPGGVSMGKEACRLYGNGCSKGRACNGKWWECGYFLATENKVWE
jgi:hypothetical protein